MRTLLATALTEGWKARRDFYVGADLGVYFSELQSRQNDFRAPDLFVALGVDPHERKSWVVWEEDGHSPDVVIEILSESTEHIDRGEKMRIYARVLKVAAYYLYDPFTCVLEGYGLDAASGEYRRLEPVPSGRLPCAPLGLELGLWKGEYRGLDIEWLRWFEPDGRLVETAAESGAEIARHAAEEARTLAERLAEYERRFGKLER